MRKLRFDDSRSALILAHLSSEPKNKKKTFALPFLKRTLLILHCSEYLNAVTASRLQRALQLGGQSV